MKSNLGKELFKSEALGPRRVIKYGGLYVLGSLLVPYIFNLFFSIKERYYLGIWGSSVVLPPIAFLVLVYILPEFKPFQPYLIVYQKAVKFRVTYLRILPIIRIIPKEEITHIEMITKVHRFYISDKLHIYVEGRKPFKMGIRWIQNYGEALAYF